MLADDQDETLIYSVDSSALIHAWRRAYPPKHFRGFWNAVDDGIQDHVSEIMGLYLRLVDTAKGRSGRIRS